nr:PREDICTED: uncharacterized protein LOC109031500 isoform X9 [Bemisia tabaci]
MYVIFPAEDLVELTLTRPPVYLSPTAAQQRGAEAASPKPLPRPPPASKAEKSRSVEKARAGKKVKVKKSKWDKDNEEEDSAKMATGSGEGSLRDLSHPSLNEPLRAHNAATFKLVRTVSDFTQELSKMYEQHAEELQHLVANFRKKNAELRKERPACPSSLVHTWESLLQEVEVDSQAHSDVASVLGRQVSRPLLERSFHRKVQSRKVFAHRETLELMINKAEDKLAKARQDYKNAYLAHLSSPSSSVTLTAYLDAHNHYVSTLHATNGMIEKYSHETLPQLLQELEDVYSDLCSTLSDSVLQGAEVISARAIEQSRRYETLSAQCRSVLPSNDLAHFVRSLSPLPTHPHPTHRLRLFNPPQPPNQEPPDGAQPDIFLNHENLPPSLRNELVIDRSASLDIRTKYDSLRVEEADLMAQISKLQDSLDTLCRIQQRSVESSLFNKANEIQEDISVKKLDLRTAQIHLAAVRAQKDLFATKFENNEGNTRKMSSASTGSMKSKWIKAFKILKAPSGPSNGSSNKESERKHQMYHAVSTIIAMRKSARDGGGGINSLETAHQFQEYTYKKITPCDVCSQVLRGHTRQGLKCRLCKMNVHLDCQDKATSKCNSKSRLLRRQKSTSEIETRISATQEEEAPSSPVHNRRLLSARNMRMSSVELPDDNEKSLSSASTSPCPSPKPHRLLPTNLYVVLYNFKSRHADELDLKAGYKVTVIDSTDQDWWKGKCLGRVGYFPSKYVTKLQPGERPLQVIHNLQVKDGDCGLTLLRDQIVIQIGEEVDGTVMIRNGDNRQGFCPVKYLQEV